MSWEVWVLVISVAVSSLLAVTQVGRPRQPLSGGIAAFLVVCNAGFIWLILRAGGVL